MRSLLFVPADSEKKLAKGLESGADILIVDLEDSVSAGQQAAAREMAPNSSPPSGAAPLPSMSASTICDRLTDDDLAAVVAARPRGIMLPKCNGGEDVSRLSVKLQRTEAEAGLEDGATRIIPLVTETAIGVLNAAHSYATRADAWKP
jgi:citrate lyase subunit beta / citryl-CoA lyase